MLIRYTSSIISSLTVLLFMLMVGVDTDMSLAANITVYSLCYFIALVFFAKICNIDNRLARIIFVVFIAKVIIGITHYLLFIEPDFFSTDGHIFEYGVETDEVYRQLEVVVHEKIRYGILYFSDNFYATHPEIWNIIGAFFSFSGINALSIVPMNSFFTTIASYSIYVIAQNVYGLGSEKLHYVWKLAIFYPFFWLSDTFHRDEIGLSFMIISLTLYLLSKPNTITHLVAFGLVLFTGYILRTIYPLIFVAALIINRLSLAKNRGIAFVGFMASLVIGMPLLITIISGNEEMSVYIIGNKLLTEMGIVSLPIRVLIGIIGPFPWSQFLFYPIRRIIAFQLNDYFLGVLHLSIFWTIIKNRDTFFSFRNLGVMEYFGILLFLAAIFTSSMEISYVTVGVIFLLVALGRATEWTELQRALIWCFIILFLLNGFASVYGDFGITKTWK